MAWYSLWHDGDVNDGDLGDVGPYAASVLTAINAAMLLDTATYGVMPATATIGGFALSGAVSPLTLSSGLACVNGRWVYNTANYDVTITTPAASTRYDRVVLRYTAATNEIRPFDIEGTEGVAAYPTVTQNATYWDIPLYKLIITTGGAITLTNERYYLGFAAYITDSNIVAGTLGHDRMAVRTKPIFVPVTMYDETTAADVSMNNEQGGLMVNGDKVTVYGRWVVPPEVIKTAGYTLTPYAIVNTVADGGNFYTDFTVKWGASGESYAIHSATTGWLQTAVAGASIQQLVPGPIIDIDTDNLESEDIVTFIFQRDSGAADDDNDNDCYVSGIVLIPSVDS